jgi:glycosyltransferase involved in cell wall biosynthesis
LEVFNNNSVEEKINRMKIAIIDKVGSKAGIDHYDNSLLRGLIAAGDECYLYSNFDCEEPHVKYKKYFHNVGVGKLKSIISSFTGFFISMIHARFSGVQWLIFHIFSPNSFDLITLLVARLLGFKVLTIVHDIESLEFTTSPIIKNWVVDKLPNQRVVHNNFCKEEIAKIISEKSLQRTAIIPHVNFIQLFNKYHANEKVVEEIKSDNKTINQLSPKIADAIKNGDEILLFFGQIKKAKGVDVLLKAAAETKSNYKLIIAGKLRFEDWDRYDAIIKEKNLEDKVIPVIRHISDEERDVLFAISKAVILPYRFIYQSGVLLMAMSFPKLVLASDLSPNSDIVEDGKNGFLFKCKDVSHLAVKMDNLFSENYDKDSLLENAMADIERKNNPVLIGSKFHAVMNN